jgi:hypothetical protein
VNATIPPLPTTVRKKRFPFIWYALVLVPLVLFAIAPLVSVFIASSIAEAHGCALNVSRVHPCIVNGTDYGQTLLTMSMMAWMSLFTLPVGAVAFMIWLTVLIVHFVNRSRPTQARG